MKLSVVIICWNDRRVLIDCLKSIVEQTAALEYEVVVSDNGSTDGSVDYVRQHFPQVRVIENGANLGFARGNNAGIRAARGEYVLVLNPDTIIRDKALLKLVEYADRHADAGAFGCRVLNPDGSFQNPARPLPSVLGTALSGLTLRWLGIISPRFDSDLYYGWDGRTEREIGFQSGCCILVRRSLLEELGGFDEQFFYHFEETDLCARIWKRGSRLLFCPTAEITHLGGQSVGRFPVRFALETYRSRYRYFHKHFGERGLRRIRWASLLYLGLRHAGYSLRWPIPDDGATARRLEMYRVLIRWNWRLDPLKFIRGGVEPDLGYAPLAPAPALAND